VGEPGLAVFLDAAIEHALARTARAGTVESRGLTLASGPTKIRGNARGVCLRSLRRVKRAAVSTGAAGMQQDRESDHAEADWCSPCAPYAAGAEEAAAKPIEPRIGLTRNQVRTSAWGEPIEIVREDDDEGGTETWYYDPQRKRAILFDARGKVAEISR
jgi:hypothetical protein